MDFTFVEPENLTYDGTEKAVTVTSDKEGIGAITIKYCKEGSDSWTDSAPTDAGTYKVKINVTEGDNYNAGTNITADDWTFTIDRAIPKAMDFTFVEPENLTYDGTEKVAKVMPSDGIKDKIGDITVKYYDSKGTLLTAPPTNAGTYTVKIDIEKGTDYVNATDLTGEEGNEWIFTIKKAEPTNPRTPSEVSIIYGTKLSDVNLSDGWEWDDGSIVPTIENEGYKVFYKIEDNINYDWSNIDGYNPETYRIERKIAVEVSVDKSTWGEKVENSGLINYVDEDGATSAEVTDRGMIWIKESSDGTSAWYAIDNSKGIFKLGSRFSVRWLSKDSDPEEWENYYNNLDEVHKNAVESNRLWIFIAEIIDPDGVKYTNLDSEVPFYIELGQDWDKDDINAVFISQGADEVLDTEYVDDMECPEGSKEFAKLTLKHFSPYAVYDRLENQETLSSDIENKDDLKYNFYLEDEDKGLPALVNWFTTGDTNTLIIVAGLAVLVIASGVVILLLKKKRKI
ncbi:MAG: MBG domain-containing protein, partial [Acutalibacteraceae bacterium]